MQLQLFWCMDYSQCCQLHLQDTKFDLIVGVLESIVMDPSFRSQHEAFCRTNCQVFENTEENKLVYTTLFQQYTELTGAAAITLLLPSVPACNQPSSPAFPACSVALQRRTLRLA